MMEPNFFEKRRSELGNISQNEIVARCGVGQGRIPKLENFGILPRKAETRYALAEAYEITYGVLVREAAKIHGHRVIDLGYKVIDMRNGRKNND